MGIDIDRTIQYTFAISGRWAAPPARCSPHHLRQLQHGRVIGIKAFVAATLGASAACRARWWRHRLRRHRDVRRAVHLLRLQGRARLWRHDRHPARGALRLFGRRVRA